MSDYEPPGGFVPPNLHLSHDGAPRVRLSEHLDFSGSAREIPVSPEVKSHALESEREFDLRWTDEEGLFTIELEGELDIGVVDQLERLVPIIEGIERPRVVVDLRELQFVDSSGMHCLIKLDQTVTSLGGVLVLIRGPESLMRAFGHAGLDAILTFAGSSGEGTG